MEDFTTFLREAHARGIRVILDLVLNHTSVEHPWFLASRTSRESPKRDWYIWRDGRDGGPPNNWASVFGGSAWELDEATGQYYYHFHMKEQPDLLPRERRSCRRVIARDSEGQGASCLLLLDLLVSPDARTRAFSIRYK